MTWNVSFANNGNSWDIPWPCNWSTTTTDQRPKNAINDLHACPIVSGLFVSLSRYPLSFQEKVNMAGSFKEASNYDPDRNIPYHSLVAARGADSGIPDCGNRRSSTQ